MESLWCITLDVGSATIIEEVGPEMAFCAYPSLEALAASPTGNEKLFRREHEKQLLETGLG